MTETQKTKIKARTTENPQTVYPFGKSYIIVVGEAANVAFFL